MITIIEKLSIVEITSRDIGKLQNGVLNYQIKCDGIYKANKVIDALWKLKDKGKFGLFTVTYEYTRSPLGRKKYLSKNKVKIRTSGDTVVDSKLYQANSNDTVNIQYPPLSMHLVLYKPVVEYYGTRDLIIDLLGELEDGFGIISLSISSIRFGFQVFTKNYLPKYV